MTTVIDKEVSGRKIEVLWLIKTLGPGGAERLLVNHAALHDSESFRITCAYIDRSQNHFARDLIKFDISLTCLSRCAMDPFWPVRLGLLLVSGKFDLVHSHSPLLGAVARMITAIAGRHRRLIHLSTHHNERRRYRLPTRLMDSLTSRWDRSFIAVSEAVFCSLRPRDRQRAQVVIHGVDEGRIKAELVSRREAREELQIPVDCLALVSIASFTGQKDHENLFSAFAALHKVVPSTFLVAFGDGPLVREVLRHVDELGISEAVHFAGVRHDVTKFLSAFDVFVLASKWEGLPVALMEAISAGLPVVATSVGGVKVAFANQPCAVLVEPQRSSELSKALEVVLRDDDRRERMARAASVYASSFSARRSTCEIENIYRRLIGMPLKRCQ